jgi:hypothetical protein
MVQIKENRWARIHTILAGVAQFMSYHRLDDRGSIPAEAKYISSSVCVQTSSEAHPASYAVGSGGGGGSSLGIKRGRGVTLTTHIHLV